LQCGKGFQRNCNIVAKIVAEIFGTTPPPTLALHSQHDVDKFFEGLENNTAIRVRLASANGLNATDKKRLRVNGQSVIGNE